MSTKVAVPIAVPSPDQASILYPHEVPTGKIIVEFESDGYKFWGSVTVAQPPQDKKLQIYRKYEATMNLAQRLKDQGHEVHIEFKTLIFRRI